MTEQNIENRIDKEFNILREELKLQKEIYYYELERKEKVFSRLNLMISIFVFLASALVYLVNEILQYYPLDLKFTSFTSLNYFWLFTIISMLALIIAIVYIIKGAVGYNYQILPLGKDISRDIDNLVEYDSKIKSIKKDYNLTDCEIIKKYNHVDLKTSYENYLKNKFTVANSINSANNDTKDKRMYIALSWFIFSFIFTIITTIPFFSIKYSMQSTIDCTYSQHVKPTSNKSEDIMSENDKKPEPVKTTEPNKDTLPVIPKPEPTPNRIVKADVIPPKTLPDIKKPEPTPNRTLTEDAPTKKESD
jgi:hypothetical protein